MADSTENQKFKILLHALQTEHGINMRAISRKTEIAYTRLVNIKRGSSSATGDDLRALLKEFPELQEQETKEERDRELIRQFRAELAQMKEDILRTFEESKKGMTEEEIEDLLRRLLELKNKEKS